MKKFQTGIDVYHAMDALKNKLQTMVSAWGRSPGLVVMGGDSTLEGREFKSQDRTLDGHFFTHIFIVKL